MGALQIINEAIKGGKAATVGLKAADRAAAGRAAAELIKSQEQVKASEALGQLMEKGFKRTTTTQADRTRVGGGNIGGAPFSAISEADPNYAGKVWGVMDEGTAARLKNLTMPDTAWTTMLGSANQLKTNPIVFDKLKKGFVDAMKQGKLSDELEAKINHNLALTFGEGADIRDPSIWKQADTFEKRAALADLMMGKGIPPKKGGVSLGGEKSGKGVIFRPTDILIRETEPSLLHPKHGGEAPTFAAGPRLFQMEKESEYRPDLHPGFPTLITGKDLGLNVKPTPTEVYLPDWHKKFKEANPDRKAPGYYDLALGVEGEGLPSQELNDEYIRHLLREGFAEGGEVHADHPDVKLKAIIDARFANAEGMAEGGEVGSADARLKAAIDARLGQHMEGDEPHMGVGGLLNKAIKAIREVPEVSRLDMNFKDVTKRIPELTEAANKLANGELTAAQYDKMVNKLKPVQPYEFVPQPATAEDAMRALTESKRPMFGKTEEMQAGEPADLRLDIPAYKDHGVWVNSIHRKKQPTVYGATSSVKNATMIGSPDKALEVAKGGAKSPFAVIRGEWNPMTEQEAVANAQQYLDHPEWTQVGYDPERHGYFYDRATMKPVEGAEEVIQIGPLVLAKNPQYGKKTKEKYADGGLSHFAAGGSSRRKADVTEALTEGLAPMLYGGAKGALASLLGFPGELEQLGRTGINFSFGSGPGHRGIDVAEEPFLPNTKRVSGALPNYRGSKVANEVAEMGTGLGENIVGTMLDPMAVLKGAKPALKALKMLPKNLPVGMSIKPVGDIPTGAPKLTVKPPSDNVANVRDANFQYPKTVGNQTVDINKLSGGVRMSDPNEVKRVKALADQMSSPEGYISRIIVDHNNNVIEGQHRLEALRQLGVKDVPVYKIEDLADTMPVSKMEEAIREAGGIRSDHVNQLMQHALDDISEGGIEGARKLDYGKFQKHYDAALDAVSGMSPILPAAEREANLVIDAKFIAPQDEALRLAQQRASLPPSQGGLGLPVGNTAMDRAKAMGIDVETSYIHSTHNPFTKINEGGKFSGIFTLPNYSANYGTSNMPLVVRGEIATSNDLQRLVKRPTKKMQMAIDERIPNNVDITDATVEMQKLRNELAKKHGFSGVKVTDEFGQDTVALVNPDNIRSRFAAFDPLRKTAATAAAAGLAAPDLLAEEKKKAKGGKVNIEQEYKFKKFRK